MNKSSEGRAGATRHRVEYTQWCSVAGPYYDENDDDEFRAVILLR